MTTKDSAAYRVSICGMLIALAMIFSYLEALVPISLGIPGVKLGLANLVTIVAVYQLSVYETIMIAIIRIVLSSVLFSNLTVMLYSLAGAALSLIVMLLLKQCKVFSRAGVSIGGGVAHNIGQLSVAFLMLENQKVLYYAPVLIISGTVAGALIGVLAAMIIKKRM